MDIKECKNCNFAKNTKTKHESFQKTEERQIYQFLELLYLEIWGPAPIPSLGGVRYFLNIIDDHSRYSCIYILNHKYQAFQYFKNFKASMEKHLGKKIKRIGTDWGGCLLLNILKITFRSRN